MELLRYDSVPKDGGGGGVVLPPYLGGGVPLGLLNPDPVPE